jgi:hypothetical protein
MLDVNRSGSRANIVTADDWWGNYYSYLRASIGSRCAARRAGYRPNTRPTVTDTRNARRIEFAATIVDQPDAAHDDERADQDHEDER